MVRQRWSLQQVRLYNYKAKLSDNDLKQRDAKDKQHLGWELLFINEKKQLQAVRRK